MRDDLSPRDIVNASIKRQAKKSRRRRREEVAIDAPDYHGLMRRQEALHKAKVKTRR